MVRRSKKPKKAAGANFSFCLWFLRCCKAFSAVPLGLVKGPPSFALTKQILRYGFEIQRAMPVTELVVIHPYRVHDILAFFVLVSSVNTHL